MNDERDFSNSAPGPLSPPVWNYPLIDPTPPAKPRPRKYRPGGLLRCCIHALKGAPSEDEWKCPHCKAPLRYRDGAWEWAKANIHVDIKPQEIPR